MSHTMSKVGASGFSVKHGLPASAIAADVVAVEARRRDVHHRVDVGVPDDLHSVGAGVLDRPVDARDPLDAGRIRVGRRNDAHQPVVGEEAQRRRVRLRDRPAADDSEPKWVAHAFRENDGASLDSPCSASIGSRRSP